MRQIQNVGHSTRKLPELLKTSMSWEAKQKVREYSRLKRTKGERNTRILLGS